MKEVAREMTTKAGQKCTAIRRAIVPAKHIDAVATRLRERLAKVVVGDPSVEGVRMGALASDDQQRDVAERLDSLLQSSDMLFGARDGFEAGAARTWPNGAFFAPTLLHAPRPARRRRRPRYRSVRPGQHPDDLRRYRRSAGPGRTRQGQPGGYAWSPRILQIAAKAMPVAAASHGRVLRAGPRIRGGLHRPRPRRCRSSSTAALAAPVAVKSWAACAR